MDADLQLEVIKELQNAVEGIRDPIPSSHSKANGALRLLHGKIELIGEICWKVDDELRRLLEVFSLWEKQGFLKGQHAIGNSWISIRLTDPVFIMSVFSAVRGDWATLELRRTVLDIVKQEGAHLSLLIQPFAKGPPNNCVLLGYRAEI